MSPQFFESAVSRYCPSHMYRFLEKASPKDPYKCVKWIGDLSKQWQSNDIFSSNMAKKVVPIMVSSYNAIRKYNNDDTVIERAMDLLDDFMEKDYMLWFQTDCLCKHDD